MFTIIKQTTNSSLRGRRAGEMKSMKIRHIIIKQDEQKIEWSYEEAPCGLQIQKMQMKEYWQSPWGNQQPGWDSFWYTSLLSNSIPKPVGHFVPYHFRVEVLSILRMVDSHQCFCADSFAVIPLAHLWLSCTKILWAVSSRTSCNLEKQLTVVLVNNKQSSKKQHWHQTIIAHYIKLQVPHTIF